MLYQVFYHVSAGGMTVSSSVQTNFEMSDLADNLASVSGYRIFMFKRNLRLLKVTVSNYI